MRRVTALLLPLCFLFVFVTFASGQRQDKTEMALDESLGITTIPLWQGIPPGAKNASSPDTPTLTVFAPQPGKANGTSVIIAPGGAYIFLASNIEGRQVADWFTALGITAFVLKYRLGRENIYPIPLVDAQRSIRLVRSLAAKYAISQHRIGMVGFSAGGHLAATAGTLFDDGQPSAIDPADRFSDRPDFLILGYPWLNAMQPNAHNLITYCSVLGTVSPDDCQKFEKLYTPALHVTPRTPPTFIYSTSDDKVVPVRASVDFYQALNQAAVSVELHIFRHGEHGSGLGTGDASLDAWPELLESWLRDQGMLEPDAAAIAAAKAALLPPRRKPGEHLSSQSQVSDILSDAPAVKLVEGVCGVGFFSGLPDAAKMISLKALAPYFPCLSQQNIQKLDEGFPKLSIQ